MRSLDSEANGDIPLAPLWIPRSEFLCRLDAGSEPREAGLRVWASSEPWVRAMFDLARDPRVRLAELLDWTALLDRHSAVDVGVRGSDTRVFWANIEPVEANAAECEFRLGVLMALVSDPEHEEVPRVVHDECRARGAARCVFTVCDLLPRADPLHERMFYESRLLEAGLQGREALFRRMSKIQGSIPMPDLRVMGRLRRFMEEFEDIILVFDRNLAILDANRAALRFSQVSLDVIRGLSARDLLSADSFAIVKGTLPILFESGGARGLVVEGRNRDGWVPLEVSARVVSNGQLIICMARDISQYLALERELAERNRQLRDQNERIRGADLLKSEFLANVSHELNTPLTCIRGFSKMLLGDLREEQGGATPRLDSDKRLEFVQIIGNEAVRMGDLISGLLELAKIESGIVTLDKGRTSLNEILLESVEMLKPRLDERALEIEQKLDTTLRAASLDADRMKQVALNLLENAIKFSPQGSRITITSRSLRGMQEFAVANSAPDIDEAQLESLFDRFVQQDGSFARHEGGVGLGLNLVRAIAELHDGKAWAELVRPGRVEFVVRIPEG
jgi:PAS domain S-box-containing protein